MTTLVVTTTHDYSQDNLSGITEIDFDNTTSASATFAASQFDNTHISSSVHIVINNGSSNPRPFNDIYITMTLAATFSAANWTVTNWFAGFVELGGSTGVDHITGSPVFNYFHVTAGDVLTGGAGGNAFDIANGSDIGAGGQIIGGAGTDRLEISGSGTYDFTQIAMSSIEGAYFFGTNQTALFTSAEFANVNHIQAATNTNIDIAGSSINLSGILIAIPAATLTLTGTSGSDTLIGSSQNDILVGGLGNDTLNGGPGYDIALYSSSRSSYTIARSGLTTTVSGPDGTDTLTSIEILQFTDGTMPLTPPNDFNGDGTSDVLWINPTNDTVGDWLMNNGTPTWNVVGQGSSTVNIMGFGNFTGNGTSDILWENPSNGVVGDWLMSNNVPTWHQIGQGSTTMNIADVGDFNGDGISDILWQNPTNNYVGIWQMQNNVPTWEAIGYGSTTVNIEGVGDFTGNGQDDILWENPSNGVVGMWAINGSTPSWSQIGQGSTTMNIVGTGNFTGTGTDDVLWENPTNGTVGFWGMTNGQATSWNVVGTANTTYQVIGIGDYFGNGIDESLWRDASTGDTGILQMNTGQGVWHDLGISSLSVNPVKP